MIITPVIIPMKSSTPTCPACGGKEDTINICKNCGYEYPEKDFGFWGNFVCGLIVCVVLWVFMTVVWWLINWYDGKALFDIFKEQWEIIKNLKIV